MISIQICATPYIYFGMGQCWWCSEQKLLLFVNLQNLVKMESTEHRTYVVVDETLEHYLCKTQPSAGWDGISYTTANVRTHCKRHWSAGDGKNKEFFFKLSMWLGGKRGLSTAASGQYSVYNKRKSYTAVDVYFKWRKN